MSTAEAIVVSEIQLGLVSLRDRANAIVVQTAEQYAAACQIALDGRSYIKDVGFKLDPGIESAKKHLDFLRNEKGKYVDPAKQIVEIAAQKAEAWKAEERRKAEAEQARINEERRREAARIAEEERRAADKLAEQQRKERQAEIERMREAGALKAREAAKLAKQAESDAIDQKQAAAEAEKVAAANVQEVKVKAAVPTVAGIKARVNWKFRVVDASKVKRAYMKPDEVAIGAEVRSLKDKAKAEELIGGIEVSCEDGI